MIIISIYGKLLRAIQILSGFSILIIIVTITLDIVGRRFFGSPLHGASEISVLLLVALVWMGLPAVQMDGQNYRVDLLINIMPPIMRRIFALIASVISLAVIALLTWYTIGMAMSSYSRLEVSFGVVAFPIWPSRAIIAAGMSLLCLQLLVDVGRAVDVLFRDGNAAERSPTAD